MNIVTIKAKARLAAMKLHNAKECSTDDIASMLEQVFIPDPANNDLIEALKTLKFCKDVMCTCIIPLSDKMPLVSKCIYDARKVLEKYPNLI